MFGYIYVRETIFRQLYGVVKIGVTNNLVDREATYITGEYVRGEFIMAYEVNSVELGYIDNNLKYLLEDYHRRDSSGGGIEYYDISVLDKMPLIMDSLGRYHRRLTEEELIEIKRVTTKRLDKKVEKRMLIPREYQKNIVDKSVKYFETNDKGLLVLMCGMGKTLISLWISQEMGCKRILIGVPNKLLLEQWIKEFGKIFPGYDLLAVKGGVSEKKINKFTRTRKKFVIITTFHSSFKLVNIEFDMKILDEVHHLTTEDIDTAQERNSFVKILEVRSKKQIGLTATMKELENFEKSVSNDDKDIFGDIIEERNLLWAIDKNIVTDYLIQTVQVKKEVVNSFSTIRTDNERNLMLAAYCAVESIKTKNSKHMLIYCNTTENSILVINFIKNMDKSIYSASYHSNMSLVEQQKTLEEFTQSPCGIISCVYCLGEGWDFPQLDATLFAEKMTSNIRIVQSALRACRKNRNVPDKLAKIILPVLYRENWLEDNSCDDMRKVREVIYQMSMEDERIMQKIVFTELSPKEEGNGGTNSFGQINDDITSQLILKTIHRNQLGITYEKAKQIIREENIESVSDYLELCKRNTKLNEDPKNHFGDRFVSWIDYLTIGNKYYDLETAKYKIQEFLKENYDTTFGYIELAQKIMEKDNNFPPVDLWKSYYNINDIDQFFLNNSIPESIF